MDDSEKHLVDQYGLGVHRYRTPFRQLHWSSIKPLLDDSIAGWTKHNTPRLGAALAFYTLLSLMPLLLIAISIAGLVLGSRAAEVGVLQQIQMLIGAQRARIVRILLEGTQNRSDGFIAATIGTITLIFGASGVLLELRAALNTIWDVEPRRLTTAQEIASIVKKRLWSFALVLVIGVLLTGSLVVSTWISAASSWYTSIVLSLEIPMQVVNAVISFALLTGLIAVVYKMVPEISTEWHDVILGAAVTSTLFTFGNLLLGLYLGKASFTSTYGAAASSVLFALWVYYSSQIFFLGAEFTKAFAERYGSHPSRQQSRAITTNTDQASAVSSPVPSIRRSEGR